jgi:hypothetical protein
MPTRSRASPTCYGIDEEMELVDQPIGEECRTSVPPVPNRRHGSSAHSQGPGLVLGDSVFHDVDAIATRPSVVSRIGQRVVTTHDVA